MNEESLFLQALTLSAQQRAVFLDQACAGDAQLRAAVEALLAAHEKPGNVLDQPLDAPTQHVNSRREEPHFGAPVDVTLDSAGPIPAAAEPTATTDYRREAAAGVVIAGRYELQQKIGEGGMGEVWVAKQTEPVKRKVALKLIKTGMDSRAVLQRFEQERQALAMMDHPNIARVLDAGVTATGQPFFVMELVNGLPLTTFCDASKLSPKDRLQLFVPICQAVQHAHQKGIVHRDLKPANILVTLVDDRPVPKVIDFGVAKATSGKLTDATMSTGFGAVVGTLEYMSPEQAGLSSADIDTRADIYSLGVILYELLTGLRPFDAERLKQAALTEMIRIIQEEEPSKPSTRLSTNESLPSLAALRHSEPKKLTAMLRGDLDWVVLKCLEKKRERRYETANGLARDIQRYLAGETVEARPPSVSYRLGKFLKRNKGPVLAAGLVLVVLVGGIIGTSWGLWRANQARAAEATLRLIAERSAEVAQQQRVRAEAREAQAIDAVDRFSKVVVNEPELKNSPRLENLRKRLLSEPLEFFKDLREGLQADRDTRPESLDRLAQASFDLGFLTYQIGDLQDALTAHYEALKIRQKLADGNPTIAALQSQLAESHYTIGYLLSATGNPAQALAAYESSLRIRQRLADANPNDAECQSSLAASHNMMATLLSETGRPEEAMSAYKASLAILQQLSAEDPEDTVLRSRLAGGHNDIGLLLRAAGKANDALKAMELAAAIQQELAEAHPTVTQYQTYLAHHLQSIGSLLAETGKSAEALQPHRRALGIRQKLVDAHPTVTDYQTHLATSHHSIGNVLITLGKPDEAMQAFETARSIQQTLADTYPTVPLLQSQLARTIGSIAASLTNDGKPADAVKQFELALAINQKLVDSHPSVTEYQNNLAHTHHNIGRLSSATGNLAQARRAYEAALAIQQQLADANPDVIPFQNSLADTYTDIAFVQMVGGDLANAQVSFEAALVIRQKLAIENPRSSDFASNVGGSLNNVAMIDVEKQRYEQARERLREAVVWQRKALEMNPANPTYRQYMNNHLTLLAAAARGLGDSAGLAEAEREYAELRNADPATVALDARLSAMMQTDQQPIDNAERLQLAQRAYDKTHYATAARLFSEALAADPALGQTLEVFHLYNAACCAALAGSGQDTADPPLDEATKAKWRGQARQWLNTELAKIAKLLETAPAEQRLGIAQILQHWKVDSDLGSIRDADQIAALPESEQQQCQALWKQVDDLLAKTQPRAP